MTVDNGDSGPLTDHDRRLIEAADNPDADRRLQEAAADAGRRLEAMWEAAADDLADNDRRLIEAAAATEWEIELAVADDDDADPFAGLYQTDAEILADLDAATPTVLQQQGHDRDLAAFNASMAAELRRAGSGR